MSILEYNYSVGILARPKVGVVANKVQLKIIEWYHNHFVGLDIPKAFMVLEIIYPAWFLFEIQFILLDCILLQISFSSLLKKWVLEYKCLRACTKLLFRYNFHTILKCNHLWFTWG